MRRDLTLVDERRPVRNDLFRLRPPAGKARDTRRAVEHKGSNLSGEALHGRPVARSHADAELNLGGVTPVSGQRTVCRGRAKELGMNLVEAETETVETLPQHAIGDLRLLDRVGPGVQERAD